jgi:hypothetical protein
METKLTLRLNDRVIERAKIYAKTHKISLSKMIEAYLDNLTSRKEKTNITPLVESLSGVIDIPAELDFEKGYIDNLIDKHK